MRRDLEEALIAAHEIAMARRARLDALREALLAHPPNFDRIVHCARAVVGLEEPEPPRKPRRERAARRRPTA